MDNVSYEYKDGKNILTIMKYLIKQIPKEALKQPEPLFLFIVLNLPFLYPLFLRLILL